MVNENKVVVVGGGISGLISATLLAKKGIKVTLIEKNEVCGGLVNSFTEEGFVFDGGIRAIENAGMIIPMIKELDLDLILLPSKVSLGIENEVIHTEAENGINEYETLLKHMYPESIDDVEKVIKVIKDFNVYMEVLFGEDSPFYKDKKKDKKYFCTTFIIWFFKFLKTGKAITKMKNSVEDFLHKLISNDSLFDIISQHFFKKTPAFFAMSYFSLYSDYYYPKGGVGKLAQKIEEKFVELGGTLIVNTEICKMDFKLKTLFDKVENSYPYDNLIWCADLKKLYEMVDVDQVPKKIVQKARKEKEKIISSKGAESVFTLYCGINEKPDFFQNISDGHFFYTPSKKGLGSLHREDLSQLLNSWEKGNKEQVLTWLNDYCKLNTFEISLPVLNDPDAAPKGQTGLIVSFLMEYELVENINKDGWYKEFKTYVENLVIGILNDTIYPGIKEKIIFKKSLSPLSVKKRVGSSEGAIVGWSFENSVPISAGVINMKNAILTSLPDVYKAGQWTVSPAGLPTCIMTAKMSCDRVLKELGK